MFEERRYRLGLTRFSLCRINVKQLKSSQSGASVSQGRNFHADSGQNKNKFQIKAPRNVLLGRGYKSAKVSG